MDGLSELTIFKKRGNHVTVNRLFLRGIVVGFFLCLTGSLALGASNRTWVSGGGTDSGTCTRSTPCATFAFALMQTNAGGEIDALDSGDFGNGAVLAITQSVSIVADGVLGGILVTSGNAITVSIGANDVVVLRGLTIDSVGSSGTAIQFSSGGALHIESCTISNFSTGIAVFDGGHVFIKDTIVRNNRDLGIDVHPTSATTVTASLDNVRLEGNGFGSNNLALSAGDGTNISVRNSVVAGNAFGLQAASSGRAAVINLESSIVSGNAHTGILSGGSSATINITNVTVVNNSTGLSTTGGQIVSFGNNKIASNTTNGSPTKTIAQH
jgi:hypothetical protein